MEGYYKVSITPYIFFVQVKLEDDMYVIRLGTHELPDCGSVQVYEHHQIAELHGIVYNELCATNVPLQRSDQGTQKMIHALIAFTYRIFPCITHIQLTDTSLIDCQALSKSVYLQDMFFYKYGMTWYEKHFGAQSDMAMYPELKLAFLKKPSLPFQTIWKYMPPNKKNKKQVQNIYKHSQTWHEFFLRWWDVDGCLPFMYIHQDHRSMLHDIYPFTRKTLYGTTWLIYNKTYTSPFNIDIEKIERPLGMQWGTKKKEPVRRLFSGGVMYMGPDCDE